MYFNTESNSKWVILLGATFVLRIELPQFNPFGVMHSCTYCKRRRTDGLKRRLATTVKLV
jgi:hypothetical protein